MAIRLARDQDIPAAKPDQSRGVGIIPKPAIDLWSMSVPAKRRAKAKNVKKVPDDKLELRRLQSKMNQRRYRAEQLELMERLNGAVSNLTTDVARLEGRVGSLRVSVPKNLRSFDPEHNIAKEYFRLFAQGFTKRSTDPLHSHQRDFVCSVMHSDLEFMNANGLGKLFTQWDLYTTMFQSILVSWDRSCVVTCHPQVMLEGQAVMHLRISRRTIEALFPHLLHNEPIVQKLIGRVLALPVLCQFTFDAAFKIKKINTFASAVVALMDLLNSAEDTAIVVEGCLVKDNAELVPVTIGSRD